MFSKIKNSLVVSLILVTPFVYGDVLEMPCLEDNGQTINQKISGENLQDIKSVQVISKQEAHKMAELLPPTYKQTAEKRIEQSGLILVKSTVDVKYDTTHTNEILILLGQKDCSTHAAYKVSSLPAE
jgi:hypothetical protein